MSSKSSSTRQSKTPLNHLRSKKWCFPPSPLHQSTTTGVEPMMSPSKSPEPNCAICLGKIEDKSFTDRCFHCFCRLCLFEWAKVKAECPVCRQAFDKIIFNIRAMDDYDEQVVQSTHRHRFGPFHSHPPFPFSTPFINLDGNPRFRYPTTLTPMRRRMIDFERRLQMQIHMSDYTHGLNFPHFIDFLDNNRRSREQRSREARNAALNSNDNILRNSSSNASTSLDPRNGRSSTSTTGLNDRLRYRGEDPMLSGHSSEWNPRFYPNHFDMDIYPPPVGTSAHRRYIYDNELYVLTKGDGNSHRTREVSARFFSANPAATHRLIPWLNRELNAILNNPNETENLVPRIMSSLLMFDITSVGFKKIIAPFTLSKTDHFIHEFYNFARSPYEMEHYTRLSVYVPKHRADIVVSEPLPTPIGFQIEPNSPHRSSPDSITSSDSSIEILSEPFQRVNPPTEAHVSTLTSPMSLRVYSIDGSDSSESSTEIRQLITPSPINTPSLLSSEAVANNDVSSTSTSNPTPLPRGDLPEVNFGNIDIIDDFDNPKPGTSGLSRLRTLTTKWSDTETTDVDVGQELENAIARFESSGKTEVKKENNTDCQTQQLNDDSDNSSHSSVLIVGYVKPLHERTPEFINLISSEEEINETNVEKYIKHKKSKKAKKDKHRKRSSGQSRSQSSSESHSKHKRKCKHKSKYRHKEKCHGHKPHRHSKYNRYSTSSSTSSDDSKNIYDLKDKHKKHKSLKHEWNTTISPTNSLRTYRDTNRKIETISPTTDKEMVSTTTSSSFKPLTLNSVVIRKEVPTNQSLKYRPYLIYSDSD